MNWFQVLMFDLSRGRMYRETNRRAWREWEETWKKIKMTIPIPPPPTNPGADLPPRDPRYIERG